MTIREAVTKQRIYYDNGKYYLIADDMDYSLSLWEGFSLIPGEKLAVQHQMGMLKRVPVGTDRVQMLFSPLIREIHKGRSSSKEEIDQRPRRNHLRLAASKGQIVVD